MISMEIRKLIVANVKDGIKVEQISRVLRVGKSSIWRLLKQEKETGSVEPRYQGKPSTITPEQRQEMFKLVEEKPDVTLEEIRKQLNLAIKKSQISNLLHKAGYHYKRKMIYAHERDREDVLAKREEWADKQKKMDISRLVFLDESGVNIDLTRLYGWGKGSNRVWDKVPLSTPKNTTLLSSVRLDGEMVCSYFSGAITGEIFLTYIKQSLAPRLKKGDTVIMDNLRVHKVDGVRQAIEQTGSSVLYLRLSPRLCKPQKWCRIETSHWRLRKWEEKNAVQKNKPGGQRSGSCWN